MAKDHISWVEEDTLSYGCEGYKYSQEEFGLNLYITGPTMQKDSCLSSGRWKENVKYRKIRK